MEYRSKWEWSPHLYWMEGCTTSQPTLALYAQWTTNVGSITFASNGGVGTVPPISSSVGSLVTLPSGSVLSLLNYSFAGWNTSPSGSGTPYLAGASILVSGVQTLYAQWTADSTTPPGGSSTVIITLDGGGGIGNLNPISVPAGSSVLLPSSAGFSKPGYTFSGWYSAASGGTFLGQAGVSIVPTASTVIFAQWTANPKVTIRFSANHGKGAVGSISGLEGRTVSLPSAAKITYPGFSFAGWNTSPAASGTSYAKGARITLSGSMTLYAQWSAVRLGRSQSLLIGAVGPFAIGSTTLSSSLKAQVRRIANAMKTENYTSAALYGYATGNGSPAVNVSLSAQRALAVVYFLQSQLASLHAKKIPMRAAGEGAIKGSTLAMFRRVEIFVK